MKKVFKTILSTLGMTLLIGFLAPLEEILWNLDHPAAVSYSLEQFANPMHWVTAFAIVVLFKIGQWYFGTCQPRTMYFCLHGDRVAIIVTFISLIWVPAVPLVSFLAIRSLAWQIVSFSMGVALYLLFLYGVIWRGVAVYKKGKVKVYKFWVKTYEAKQMDKVDFEFNGKKCTTYITICGDVYEFRMSADSAQKLKQKLAHPAGGELTPGRRRWF